MKRLLLSVLIFLLGTNVSLAQVNSNEFTISVFGSSDTESPTTPTLLTIDPVTTNQIDITWSLSTDNYAVAGYSVIRDGTPIATTTLLSYSDTSLSASTTYSYEVKAFDIALNYSSSSNSLSTTTPDVPPPPPPEEEGERTESTAARVVVDEFFIEVGVSTTSLNLNTVHPARVEVRWGRTTSYEIGYVVTNVYIKDHSIILTDLEPGTTYEYEIVAYAPHGDQTAIRTGTFTTLSESLVVSPVNVSKFMAIQNNDDVDLSWQLPEDDSISYVRIVRSHLGFPEYPQDGAIVYQGTGESSRDNGVLAQYSPVYYTAFVYDKAGNVSSGAVAMVYDSRYRSDVGSKDQFVPPIKTPVITDKPSTIINKDRVTVEMKMPKASDITLQQKGVSYLLSDDNIKLEKGSSFVVSIPREAVAGNLKSIIVTLLDPADNKTAHSYLLRINQDQTLYTATIPAVEVVGRSQIKLEIYDYEAFVVATYQAPVTFSDSYISQNDNVVFPDAIFNFSYLLLLSIIGLLIAIFIILFFILKRRDEDNNDEV